MWRATLRGLVAHKLRLGLTALAVVLGVAFVAGTFVLTDTIDHTFDNLFAQVNKGVAVTVRASSAFGQARARVPETLLPRIEAVDGVARAEGIVQGYAQVVGPDGKPITTGGAPTFGLNWVTAPENPLSLRAGRAPQKDGEAAVDVGTAEKAELNVGDRVQVLFQGPPERFTVVGLLGFGNADNLAGATIVAFDTATAQRVLDSEGKFDSIEVAARAGVSDIALRNRIAATLPHGIQAITGAKATEESAKQVKEGLGFFRTALLVFAGIALFVGTFIIFNTFSIIVAQRTRELGLLRALGASGGQVTRSVLAEAVIVGLLASGVGLGLGVLIAIGLTGLLKAFGIALPSSGLLFGLFGSVGQPIRFVGIGVALIFLGVAMLAPLVARPLSRVIGAPFARVFKVPGRLGRENASRNPRRTASTASALMIGLALVAFVSIFVQSLKASVDDVLTRSLRADFILSTSQFTGFTPAAARAVRGVEGAGVVSELRGDQDSQVKIAGKTRFVSGVDPATIGKVLDLQVTSGSIADLSEGGIVLKSDAVKGHGWKVGDRIPVRFPSGGEQRIPLVAIFDADTFVGDYLISIDTFEHEFTQQFDQQVLIKAAPGVSPESLRGPIEQAVKPFGNVTVDDQAQFRTDQSKQLDTLLGLVTALLLLAIVIALFGIVNTLVLSIFERTREIGLLRAVGMTRRQVRGMIRWESVIIAVFGAVMGIVIGLFFGWSLVQALKDQGVTRFAVPGGQLVIYVIVAGLFGVIAAVWPARRAARLDVLRAVTVE